ncbi:hypothetical protein ACFHWD_11975 [Clostridium sp. MT-14]|mgnify:CR=1|jgi:hypothetical protein|uniref:hypothetical protein n=1 Tax=unclassified Clostridium TaxID=2614128 RepID=UPI00123A5444|nr:hypothetical protein [Clostridium sp. HV4-5-A1G]KAA8663792.1 hypothetical protein F3O63_18180 [Clostridium sp. HV4-5-A1G]CAB1251248.1 conserved membrane hypothetical protein [Clostridiaceae bacterium BL-3]
MNDKNLNFNIKILAFTAILITAYFFIDKLEILVLIPCLLCIYDGIYIFLKVKNRDGLKVIFFLGTVLALIFMVHIIVVYSISDPVPIILIFIMTNLFFFYNLILYFFNKYGKLSIVLILLGWIICDSIPILMVLVLSAGLSS